LKGGEGDRVHATVQKGLGGKVGKRKQREGKTKRENHEKVYTWP